MATIVTLSKQFEPDVIIDETSRQRVLVLYLHGILANSQKWLDHQAVTGRFLDLDVHFRPVSYATVGILDLVLFRGTSKRTSLVIDRIHDTAANNKHDQLNIICHSNGCKVFSMLSTEIKQRFEWVFFSGSICHSDDDRSLSKCGAIINDCGLWDPFPILACAVRPKKYGHTGVVGFQNHPVTDRYFWVGHSTATSPQHFRNWTLPILQHGTLPQTKHRASHFHLIAPQALRFLVMAVAVFVLAILILAQLLQ